MDMNMEMPLNFKTEMPVPFKDGKTGTSVYVNCCATAIVVVLKPDMYPDRMAINSLGGTTASSLLSQAIFDLSGKADATDLMSQKKEIIKNLTDGLKGAGLQVTSIEILSIGPDDASLARLKNAPTAGGVSVDMSDTKKVEELLAQAKAISEAAKASANASAFPAFCMYCGGKAGTKFCPNCGAKLGE